MNVITILYCQSFFLYWKQVDNNSNNSNNSKFKKVIDVRGLYCPEPVFRTKIEMEKMTIGERLKVVADDPQSEEDISRWVNRNGHELISVNKKESDLEFVIKKAK
jgi:tRNA 2-thiouridine synthesizing protein A